MPFLMNKRKSAQAVSTITGADGATAFFILSKSNKITLKQWMQKKKYAIRKKWVEKHISSKSHSMTEVCEYIQKQYGFIEVDQSTHEYEEEYVQMRYSFLLQYAPELLGEYANMPELKSHSEEAIKDYLREMENRQKMAQNVPRTDFDIKLRMFQKAMEGMNGNMHISIEENYGYIGGGASGSNKAIKAFQKLFRDIYKYYGVTEEDICTKSKRYEELIRTLAR